MYSPVNPSTRVIAFSSTTPKLHPSVFLAPTATVIGNVDVAESASIWYGAVVRGDVNTIRIGAHSSIGDRTMVHVAKIQGDAPTNIGSKVTIGPNANIHACTLKDSCMIGAGASVLDNSTVEKHAVVAPGSIVTMGTTVPSGQLWAGVPARFVRELTEEEIASIDATEMETAELSEAHGDEHAKGVDQFVLEELMHKDDEARDPTFGKRLEPDDDFRKFRAPEPPADSNMEIYYGPSKTATRFN